MTGRTEVEGARAPVLLLSERSFLVIIGGVVGEVAVLDVVDDQLPDLTAGGHHAQHEQHGDEARPHLVSLGRPHAFVNVLRQLRRCARWSKGARPRPTTDSQVCEALGVSIGAVGIELGPSLDNGGGALSHFFSDKPPLPSPSTARTHWRGSRGVAGAREFPTVDERSLAAEVTNRERVIVSRAEHDGPDVVSSSMLDVLPSNWRSSP